MKKMIITLLTVFSVTWTVAYDNESDTIIIELNNDSKIIVYVETKKALADLEKYDINRIIKNLNAQLDDSVKHLEVNIDEEDISLNESEDYAIHSEIDDIKLDLGSITLEVDPREIEYIGKDKWHIKKTTYEVSRKKRTTHHFNVDIGTNNWLENSRFPDENNASYSVKPWGSWYVGLNSINSTRIGGSLFFDWGLGVSWYNWKLQDPDFRVLERDRGVILVTNPEKDGVKSKLTASYINAYLVPMIDFSKGRKKLTSIESTGIRVSKYSKKGLRIGLGGYVGYRLGSHTKFKFRKEDGKTETEKERDNFFLENFRYGVRTQIGWKGVELFGMYDLNEVFAPNRGPVGSPGLNAFTFGITL